MWRALAQVILKPAEATPLTATALAELARRAGIPAGVLNIVVGDAKAIGEPIDVPTSNTLRHCQISAPCHSLLLQS